jgi:hypothetical protein
MISIEAPNCCEEDMEEHERGIGSRPARTKRCKLMTSKKAIENMSVGTSRQEEVGSMVGKTS